MQPRKSGVFLLVNFGLIFFLSLTLPFQKSFTTQHWREVLFDFQENVVSQHLSTSVIEQ
jgi:hypothetical protein